MKYLFFLKIMTFSKWRESDVDSAKWGENAKGPSNNFDEPKRDLKTKKYLIPFLSKPIIFDL